MYAIRIRKSDLDLLAALNGGVAPSVEARPTYLIVDLTGGPNLIVSEREFEQTYGHRIGKTFPLLMKLNKK